MSLTTQQYANLAQDSYRSPDLNRHDDKNPVIDGVQYVILAHVDKESGYQGTIYQRKDTQEIIVAHRGSEFDTQPFKDGVFADGGMVAQRVNAQAADALDFTRTALDKARLQGKMTGHEPQVTVTGHSLGGCLAQVTAAKFNLNGETFNPYGAAGLGMRIPEGGSNVVNHVMAGDVVSAASKHFGKVQIYAEPVELNVLKAAGYEDNGSAWDIRNPGKAAVTGGDSHRMHHFLDVDGNGKPDRSILSQPQARDLAERHRPMIEKYRGDIELMREGVSVGVAVARGAQGIAGEIGRHLPEKAESPFKNADGGDRNAPGQTAPARDPRAPQHPDHPMYLQIRGGLGALHEREGRPFDDLAERSTASLLVASKAGGLVRVDHVLPGKPAHGDQALFAVQGELHDPAHKRAQVSVAEAARTPVEESFQKLDGANRRLAEAPAQEQVQAQDRSAPTRSA